MAEFDHLLVGRGFVASRPSPTHSHFEHRGANAIVLLPPWRPGDLAAPYHVASVRRTLIDWELMGEQEFDLWLRGFRLSGEHRVGEPEVTQLARVDLTRRSAFSR